MTRTEQNGFVSGELKVLQRISEYEFAVELKMMRNGLNENRWDFRNMEENYKTFAGTPILVAYVGDQIGDGHNGEERIDFKTGKRYRSFLAPTAERIVGMISEDVRDLSLVEEGGYTWLVAKGRLWQYYAPELVEKIVRTGRMSLSIEVNVREGRTEGKTEIYTVWSGLGVTILGDNVAPAIPGANIRALAALENEFKEMKLRVASLSQTKRDEPQKKITNKGVKHQMYENKTLAKELALKFSEYRVLAYSEDGTNVCLMSKDGSETFIYAFAESDKGAVISERIRPVTLAASVEFGDTTVTVPFSHMFDELTVRNNSLASQLEAVTVERDELNQKIATMTTRETERRKKASKEAAIAELAAINANRSEAECIAEENIAKVLSAAENGEYVECADDNGDWNGDERAKSAVRDVAMLAQMAIDAKRAEETQKARVKVYAFEGGSVSEGVKENSLAAAYSRITG